MVALSNSMPNIRLAAVCAVMCSSAKQMSSVDMLRESFGQSHMNSILMVDIGSFGYRNQDALTSGSRYMSISSIFVSRNVICVRRKTLPNVKNVKKNENVRFYVLNEKKAAPSSRNDDANETRKRQSSK